ncbi:MULTISPECIES: hypothetical protein [Nostocales]|uniref:Uncharacterized protein n=3 Tax=Nostocales TaxID=1161 RepID=A0A8S9SXT7_9CYAN|nr:hypothetical protein [Tolypothrix bouteillei]KAF3884162.1 hypothetical protein DA73_0400000600 [Tolypothrix bouteillei VB521301]
MNNKREEQESIIERILFVIFQAVFLVWQFYGEITYRHRRRASVKKYQIVLDWVKARNRQQDTACELKLPHHLARITQRGTVFALHTADDRHCILLKTWIFPGRENFLGTFYCDQPLSHDDFLPYREYDMDCISIEGEYICLDLNGEEDYGPNFKRLYVTQQHNQQLFEVEYTLN